MKEKTALITGVSSGIGAALAKHYLDEGWQVYGLSRRAPEEELIQAGIHFKEIDVSQRELLSSQVDALVNELDEIDLCILNAGQHGEFSDLTEQSLSSILSLFDVNVWANKLIIDHIFTSGRKVKQVVAMSSGASINGNRGWGAYALSKSTLNMLIRLYSQEFPECHFTAFAPGLVDTPMQESLCAAPEDPRYPSLKLMQEKRGTDQMPKADIAAPKLASAIASLPTLVESGEFCDIRKVKAI